MPEAIGELYAVMMPIAEWRTGKSGLGNLQRRLCGRTPRIKPISTPGACAVIKRRPYYLEITDYSSWVDPVSPPRPNWNGFWFSSAA